MTSLTSPGSIESDLVRKAADALRQGELVAFPTETVYGLGADAANITALKRLYRVKGRPASHPVIVHLAEIGELTDWARTVPPAAYRLAEAFWPGPMTLVLSRADGVLDYVTGGQDTVGLRIPSHPVARALLSSFGGGIAAPSANRFGRLSPTTAHDVEAELGADVSMVLDGGACQVGIESTIIDLSGDAPRILRPGMITASELEAVLGHGRHAQTLQCLDGGQRPRAPGGLPSHYAPETVVRLVGSDQLSDYVSRAVGEGKRVAVLSFAPPGEPRASVVRVAASADPFEYAADLYRQLRYLDRQRCDLIVVETPPELPLWHGIQDRLKRASAERG